MECEVWGCGVWGCGRVVCGVRCVVCSVWCVVVAVWLRGVSWVRGALVAAIDVRSGDEAGHIILRGGGVEG